MGIGSGVIINEFCDLHIIIVAAVQTVCKDNVYFFYYRDVSIVE